MNAAQERMYSRKFGVFNHFLFGAPGGSISADAETDNWNARVDSFDVQYVAKTLHEIGAGYYFITLMQGRKYMAAPNAAFDAIAGMKPGEACAKRDLILALSDALCAYDIDLYLYFTGDGPYKDVDCGEKFGFVEPRKDISLAFCRKWASVLEEYALRYGDRVRGWWIDGCYDYFGYEEERLSCYYNAVKKGNPNAMTAMNNGVRDELLKWYSGDEFTCGEYNFFDYIPKSRSIDGAQAHILAPLGLSADGSPWGGWNRPGCKCTKEELRAYVRRVHDAGGVVTIDFHIRQDCTFDADQLEVLSGIR